jgi:hypothetical protein
VILISNDIKIKMHLIAGIGNICCVTFTGFIYLVFIILPSITEIILVNQQTYHERTITLIVCASIQTLISILGSFKMGINWMKAVKETTQYTICNDTWCGCFTTPESLVSPGFAVYTLSP